MLPSARRRRLPATRHTDSRESYSHHVRFPRPETAVTLRDARRPPLRPAAVRAVRRPAHAPALPAAERVPHDATLPLLATFGIASMFLVAGLEVNLDELRRGARVLAGHLGQSAL